MAGNIDINSLGQVLDTTWGRTSTPKTASYSVKFVLHGNILTASYAAIVNFGTEKEMALMKQRYSDESNDIINAAIKNVKAAYKDLTGKTLSTSLYSTSDSLEIINFNVHNPKRTAYYRRKTSFELT
jgi:hypothetical protein